MFNLCESSRQNNDEALWFGMARWGDCPLFCQDPCSQKNSSVVFTDMQDNNLYGGHRTVAFYPKYLQQDILCWLLYDPVCIETSKMNGELERIW
jgi:hypothetical protein